MQPIKGLDRQQERLLDLRCGDGVGLKRAARGRDWTAIEDGGGHEKLIGARDRS